VLNIERSGPSTARGWMVLPPPVVVTRFQQWRRLCDEQGNSVCAWFGARGATLS